MHEKTLTDSSSLSQQHLVSVLRKMQAGTSALMVTEEAMLTTAQIYLFYSSVFGGSSAAPFTRFFYLWFAAQRRVLRAFYVLAYLLGSWSIYQRLWENTQEKWNSQANSAARRNDITSALRALNSRCRCR